MLEHHGLGIVSEAPSRGRHRRGVAVDGKDSPAGTDAFDERLDVASGTEGAVDVRHPRAGLQALY